MTEDPRSHGPITSRGGVMAKGVGINQPAAGIQRIELIRPKRKQPVIGGQLLRIGEHRQQGLKGPMAPAAGKSTGD
jgi:hypothetical protein